MENDLWNNFEIINRLYISFIKVKSLSELTKKGFLVPKSKIKNKRNIMEKYYIILYLSLFYLRSKGQPIL